MKSIKSMIEEKINFKIFQKSRPKNLLDLKKNELESNYMPNSYICAYLIPIFMECPKNVQMMLDTSPVIGCGILVLTIFVIEICPSNRVENHLIKPFKI